MTAFKRSSKKNKIASRFRNITVFIMIVIFCIVAAVTTTAFDSIIRQISSDFAAVHATSSSEVFSARISKEIALMAKAAHSQAVIEWLADENNADKKRRAYGELSDILGELYSGNLYVGIEGSFHEYRIRENFDESEFFPFATLDKDNPNDGWYFDCASASQEYRLIIGIDLVLNKKRIWLDYKVVENGVTLGVIATGLDYSHIVGEVFSQYGGMNIRGLVIDAYGNVNMDSALYENEEFVVETLLVKIDEALSNSVFSSAVNAYLENVDEYFKVAKEPEIIKLRGVHQYMAIAPIVNTDWSTVIVYNSSSLLSMSVFLPISAIILVMLVFFALLVTLAGYRLIFSPLEKLNDSLEFLMEDDAESIYGVGRNDELGNLSNTIWNLYRNSNYDALTEIPNRRYFENNVIRIMGLLARIKGDLSVLMIDIDYFKKYNDSYGHDQGDVCLKMVAKALCGSITRASDFVARYGGEEFVAVLPNTDERGARIIAERMLEQVRELNLPNENSGLLPYVTVSIGIATGKATYSRSRDDYIKVADKALYDSKQGGRNRYTYIDLDNENTNKGE